MLKSTEKGTFLVQVLDQQHNSWQGTITWLADGKKKTFRSLLEFITIVGSELPNSQASEEELPSPNGDEAPKVSSHTKQKNAPRIAAPQLPHTALQCALSALQQTG